MSKPSKKLQKNHEHACLVSDAKNTFKEICNTIANISTCFDVWRELQDARKRKLYEPIQMAYPVFFETIVIANLITLTTLIYSILETRKDTHNLPTLIRDLYETNQFDHHHQKLTQRLDLIKPTQIKLSRARNEAFGHHSKRVSPSKVFSEIKITPDEIKDVIQELKEIAIEIGTALGVNSKALNISAADDTKNLMRSLSKIHS